MLSKFSPSETDETLADIDFKFPGDVYPVGRLDKESEGLLILTNDKGLNKQLLDPEFGHSRTYLVQVEGDPNPEKLNKLASGISIRINKKDYKTKPANISLLNDVPELPDRFPPIRMRKNIPTYWLKMNFPGYVD